MVDKDKQRVFCTPGFGTFGSMIDLGLDLEPLRNRIRECKLRYHRELWSIICDLGIQGSDSGWKKRDDDEGGGEGGGDGGGDGGGEDGGEGGGDGGGEGGDDGGDGGGEGGGEDEGDEANQSNIRAIRNRNRSNAAANFGRNSFQRSSAALRQQRPQQQQRQQQRLPPKQQQQQYQQHRQRQRQQPQWPPQQLQPQWPPAPPLQQPQWPQQQPQQILHQQQPWLPPSIPGPLAPLVIENANYLSHARAKLPSVGKSASRRGGGGGGGGICNGSCSSSSLTSADDVTGCEFSELPALPDIESAPSSLLAQSKKFVPLRCGDWSSRKTKETGSDRRRKHGKHKH